MTDANPPVSPDSEFRWQAFFQRSSQPIFVLSPRRRVLFVNRAWSQLTGVAAAEARGLACTRGRPADPAPILEVLGHVLAPTRDVLAGRAVQVRRLVPAGAVGVRWWDIEFTPIWGDGALVGILGKIVPVSTEEGPPSAPLPEKLAVLRQSYARRFVVGDEERTSRTMGRLADQVRLAAESNASFFLVGEQGTGKQFTARAIHGIGPARELMFVAVDCARLPAAAINALLFGPTSLLQNRSLGTLYLRDPEELPRELQARISERLGDATSPSFRVLAGSKNSPEELLRADRLLPEFEMRLGTMSIRIPPLRERIGDLPRLSIDILACLGEGDELPARTLTTDALEALAAHAWPGNLKELARALQSARAHAKGERIDAGDLPAYLRLAARLAETQGRDEEKPLDLQAVLDDVERRLIRIALERAKGNRSKAAESLSIWRARLLRRMEALGLAD